MKFSSAWLFPVFAISFTTSAMGQVDYDKRLGVRVNTGISGYTALASKGLGLVFPLGVEGTYGITNALELSAGFRGAYSLPLNRNPLLEQPDAPYSLPYAASLGLRYYYNVSEPVKAYTNVGANIGLDRLALEFFPSTWGLQWDLDNNLSVFTDGGFGILFGSHPIRDERWEANLRFGIQAGVHYHF